MQLHKALADAQSKPRATITPTDRGVQLLEGSEEPRPLPFRNPGTGICDTHHQIVLLAPGSDRDAAGLGKAPSIAQHVQHHLAHTDTVTENGGQIRLNLDIQGE